MKKVSQKVFIITALCLAVVMAAGTGICAAEKKAAEAKKIEIDATLEKDHPAIEEGLSCNDCHEIAYDADTSATQIWISGDYLKWKAGEGVMPQEKVWQRVVDIFKGKGMKRTFALATSFNNRPYTITGDFALDPEKKVIYGFHEKGTEKLLHIRHNPYVSMNWHEEFDDNFANVICLQVLGKAELYDGTAKEFDEGLRVYPYEYAAQARKITIEQWRAIVKKDMIMSKIPIDRVRLTEGALARSNYRTSQEWKRKK